MSCSDVAYALALMSPCEETEEGSRVQTHCLYPSFEHVHVYVAKVGDGFHVHDGGEAFRCAWLHGKDDRQASKSIDLECGRFGLSKTDDNAILSKVPDKDWLLNAILEVANASSLAANSAVAKATAAFEADLASRIEAVLLKLFGTKAVGREVSIKGKSGGMRRFDFIVRRQGLSDDEILLNAVASHHVSISAKYVAFADVDVSIDRKLAVFERSLPQDEASLIKQVAIALPFASLSAGAERAMHRV